MSYQLTERLQHKVEIAAQLEAEVVERERMAILRSFGSKVRIPGFRPGKAPLAMLKSRFSEEIRGELMEKLASMALQEVLQGEENLRPIGSPQVTRIDIGADGSFQLGAELEVRPWIELRPVEELTLPEISAEVSEAEVEGEVEKLRKEQATWDPADEGPAADGMRVDCIFHGESVDDGEVIVHEENAGFIIGHPELYPELNEAMQGAKTGDTCSATKRFDENDPDEQRAGKTIRFDVTITSLKREELPDADDELAAEVGLESFEQLQERITQVLQHHKLDQRRRSWRDALLGQLAEGFDVNTLPESLVEASVNQELAKLEQLLRSQGGGDGSFDRQRIAPELEPKARQNVVETLILDQLAKEWEISVEEDLQEFVRMQAEQAGIPVAEHLANLKKSHQLEDLRYSMRLSATEAELIRRAGGEV